MMVVTYCEHCQNQVAYDPRDTNAEARCGYFGGTDKEGKPWYAQVAIKLACGHWLLDDATENAPNTATDKMLEAYPPEEPEPQRCEHCGESTVHEPDMKLTRIFHREEEYTYEACEHCREEIEQRNIVHEGIKKERSHLTTLIDRVKRRATHQNYARDPLFEQEVINLMEYQQTWSDYNEDEKAEATILYDKYRPELTGKAMPSHKERLATADAIRRSL